MTDDDNAAEALVAVHRALLAHEAVEAEDLAEEYERGYAKGYDRGYQDGIARGRRSVEDPTRFPIRRADYTTQQNEERR
jgi:flagellar biosynthesis/type III secretory pathway protein FliH